MPASDHAALYFRFVESVVNRHDLDNLDQFLAHDAGGQPGWKPVATDSHAGWQRCRTHTLLIEDLVVEGDHLMHGSGRLAATTAAARKTESRPLCVLVFE